LELTLRAIDAFAGKGAGDPKALFDAAIRDGVLTLRVPKSEQAKPRRIEVKAS
jgi:hypothetical protein